MKRLSLRTPEELRAAVSTAVPILESGGVIVCPTDTVYGFSAVAKEEDALFRIYDAKGRERTKVPLIIVSNLRMAEAYVTVTSEAKRLADTFLPGPLSLVLRRSEDLPEAFLGGTDTIGIRIPRNEFCLALVQKLGVPIISTSVNKSGEQPLSDPDTIESLFGNDIDLLIDGGVLTNPPSTIVDLSSEIPKILRVGAIDPALLDLGI